MSFQNFTLAVDADGIALVTWDMPGSLDERHRRRRDRRNSIAIVDKIAGDAAIKGAVITSGKDTLLRRRRPDACWRRCRAPSARWRRRKARRRRPSSCSRTAASYRSFTASSKPAASRGSPRSTAPALGGGFELCARLPPPRRRRQRQDARRPARDQGRPFPRRRRHAARPAPAAAGRRAANPAQGRSVAAQSRQGDEACRHRRSRRRSGRRPRRTGSRPAARRSRRGTRRASSCPAARSIPRRA